MKIEIIYERKKKLFDKGITPLEVAKTLAPKIASEVLVAKLNDELIDLTRPIENNVKIEFVTFKEPEGKEVFWHSSSHIMAEAVKRLYPEAKMAIGPAIENGFYYDFDNLKIGAEDLPKIEKEFMKVVQEKSPFRREAIPKEKALALFVNDKYKKELINDLTDETITIYTQGRFTDLCRGPHLPDTSKIKAVKLMKLAGSYWRGDAKNPMLTRIYGISFPSQKELDDHLKRLEEAEKRDHRKLGEKLDLFSFHEEAPGFPFWHPNGMIVRNELVDYWKEEHRKAGYNEVNTPIIMNKDLWLKSGHWDHYKENMYFTCIDEKDCAIKPMNCPGGILIYKTKVHSYKEFPLRVAELGLVHRHELSGVLHGLVRVRVFTQDDAHIYMTPDMLEDEINNVIDLILKMYKTFGFKQVLIELSTRPPSRIGADEMWDLAEHALESVLKRRKIEYKLNPGDGAFYGPKIDFHIKDCMERTWQCATIQVDFAMPERFDMTYDGQDGHKHRPVMIHRTVLGSLERFIGILLEHYAGKLPLWLNPVQVIVLPITDKHNGYAKKIMEQMKEAGIRAELDDRSETVSKKVFNAQTRYINYILVVGDKEKESDSVNIRTRDNVVHGMKKVKAFMETVLKEIAEKKLDIKCS